MPPIVKEYFSITCKERAVQEKVTYRDCKMHCILKFMVKFVFSEMVKIDSETSKIF